MNNIMDRRGLPEPLRDGVLRAPERWLILTKAGRKVAELPMSDLDGMDSKDLESFFSIQEEDGREWSIIHK